MEKNAMAAAVLRRCRSRSEASAELNRLRDQLREQEPEPLDGASYAEQLGEIVSRTLTEMLRPADDAAPDAETAEAAVSAALIWLHREILFFAASAQDQAYRAAGLGLRALRFEPSHSRLEGLARKVSDADSWERAEAALGEPVISFAQAVFDEFVRLNANACAAAGLFPLVHRISDSQDCAYCRDREGVYGLPISSEIFRRHQFCRCKVFFTVTKETRPMPAVRKLYAAAERAARRRRIERATARSS